MSLAAPWTVRTDVFEGPLDLLLYLVKRDGIDLARLPVVDITDAYLAYLDRMRELHLGIAGEYLVMAATLVYLKSLEMLPRAPTRVDDDEEGEDPREALARRLREYQQYREAADAMDQQIQVGREVFVRMPTTVPERDRPVTSPVDAFGLLEIYYELLTRQAAPETELTVGSSGPDVATCCAWVLEWLGGGEGELGSLLRSLPTATERVVTFVAVLEMARVQWVDLLQERHLGPVTVKAVPGAVVQLSVITGQLQAEAG